MNTESEVRRHIEYKVGAHELARDVADRMLAILDIDTTLDYSRLWERAMFVPLPEVVYHTAPTGARDSILRTGLQPMDPAAGKYAKLDMGQPTGVYVSAEPDTRGVWCIDGDEWDVWEIRTEGLAWAHDQMNPGSWAFTEPVPLEAMRLHGTFRW